MYNKIIFIAAALFLSSCNSGSSDNNNGLDPIQEETGATKGEGEAMENYFTKEDFPLEWKLESLSTMMAGSHTTGEDMPYREKIFLFKDGRFQKTRVESGNVLEATGAYSPVTQNGESFYRLTYSSNHELIENCNGSLEEMFQILDGDRAQSTAQACDHPAKTYLLER